MSKYENTENNTYLDEAGNYYCRVLNIIRNTAKGQNLCAEGCPCYTGQDMKLCRYYAISSAGISNAGEMKCYNDKLEKAGEIPYFPEVDSISKKILSAFEYASYAHRHQKRKGSGIPYLSHLISAYEIACGLTKDEDLLIAVLLHDTLEDTEVTKEQLEQRFGKRVADMVDGDSEDKRRDRPASETWKERKLENIAHVQNGTIEIKIIALSDKLSNLRSIYYDVMDIGDATWSKFNQKDKEQHRWYYSQFLKAFGELKDTAQYKEYSGLIQKIWDRAGGLCE